MKRGKRGEGCKFEEEGLNSHLPVLMGFYALCFDELPQRMKNILEWQFFRKEC